MERDIEESRSFPRCSNGHALSDSGACIMQERLASYLVSKRAFHKFARKINMPNRVFTPQRHRIVCIEYKQNASLQLSTYKDEIKVYLILHCQCFGLLFSPQQCKPKFLRIYAILILISRHRSCRQDTKSVYHILKAKILLLGQLCSYIP